MLDDATPAPTGIPAPGSYHWTPALQRTFLENLAGTGAVNTAAAMVCMSASAAYQLKHRPEGAAFRLGWAAAVLIARERLADELLERAIWGYQETSACDTLDQRRLTSRRKHDCRLGLAMLARLDRMAETRAKAGDAMLAQIIAGDWPGFLALFDLDLRATGGDGDEHEDAGEASAGLGAALACWLAGRDNRANPLASLWRGTAIANEVAQFSADPDDDAAAEATPEEEAEVMTVWFDDEKNALRTNFPPPDDFFGDEEGQFGDVDYERELEPDEEAAYESAREAEIAPLRRAGEAARRAFFGLPTAANDRSPAGSATTGSATG